MTHRCISLDPYHNLREHRCTCSTRLQVSWDGIYGISFMRLTFFVKIQACLDGVWALELDLNTQPLLQRLLAKEPGDGFGCQEGDSDLVDDSL